MRPAAPQRIAVIARGISRVITRPAPTEQPDNCENNQYCDQHYSSPLGRSLSYSYRALTCAIHAAIESAISMPVIARRNRLSFIRESVAACGLRCITVPEYNAAVRTTQPDQGSG